MIDEGRKHGPNQPYAQRFHFKNQQSSLDNHQSDRKILGALPGLFVGG
jgi:hypothetical protein